SIRRKILLSNYIGFLLPNPYLTYSTQKTQSTSSNYIGFLLPNPYLTYSTHRKPKALQATTSVSFYLILT
ncbi:hypothetical protein CHS0354_016778, partial [Potamilus streckersoni]